MTEQVTVTREIAQSPENLWAMVSDVTRMGEWSPENEGGTWLGAATGPEPGARFRGTNRNDKKKWSTVATVVDAEPGRRFSFRVKAKGFKVAEWSYSFEPAETGCRVVEIWIDQRSRFAKLIGKGVTGVDDRATHNRSGMERTLQRLAELAGH